MLKEGNLFPKELEYKPEYAKEKLEQELPKWLGQIKEILNQTNWKEIEKEIKEAYQKGEISIETEYGVVERDICDVVMVLLGKRLNELRQFEVVPLSLILPPDPELPIVGPELAHSALAVKKEGENVWYLLDPTYGLFVDPIILAQIREKQKREKGKGDKINKENPVLVVPLGEKLNQETLRKVVERPPNGYYLGCALEGEEVVLAPNLQVERVKTNMQKEILLRSYYKEYSQSEETGRMIYPDFITYLEYGIGNFELARYLQMHVNAIDKGIIANMKNFQKEIKKIFEGEVSELMAEYLYLFSRSPTLKKLDEQLIKILESAQ